MDHSLIPHTTHSSVASIRN